MGCVYMKCFSIMPLALRAKNKSFAIHWFQLLSLYPIMTYCMMIGSEKNGRPEWISHIPIVHEYLCFCFEELDTGQHKKDKFSSAVL